MFIGYLVINVLLTVNMLIAMMGNTYLAVAETRKEWTRQVKAALQFTCWKLLKILPLAALPPAPHPIPPAPNPTYSFYAKKMGQPQTNCKRRYLNGFQRRNSSPITYRKCPKVPGRESGKKRDLLELTSIELQSSMKTRLNRMSNSSAHKNPLTLFRLGGGGGGGFWCPRQLWLDRNFRQFKIILPYHRTFPQIYLAIWWRGRILIMRSGHGNSILKGIFSWNLNFLFIFYIKLDCDAWDRVFW